jgi:serpin (serine protease inhibitor)
MTSLAHAAISKRKSWWAALILSIASLCASAFAQESPQGQPASFLRANDVFAVNLLKVVQEQQQDRNIVLAPLPVSLTFAALWDGTEDADSAKEIQTAFQWEKAFGTNIAARMLLARFAKPKPYPVSRTTPTKRENSILEKYLRSGKPEEVWLSGAFLYRGKGSLSQEFIDRVKYDFGFTFRAVGEHASQS